MNTDTAPTDLAARLKSKLVTTGKLSAADLAAPEAEDQTVIAEDSKIGPRDGADFLTESASTDAGVKALMDATNDPDRDARALDAGIREIEITDFEKEAFKKAIITNSRFEITLAAMGGALTVKLQSRTLDETQAILSRERYEIDNKLIDNQFAYTARVRSMLMAAQVVRVNDLAYPGLSGPLYASIDAEGHRVEPAWLPQAEAWHTYNEALHTIIWGLVSVFERKYLKMTEAAQNSDFWRPAASIS